MDRKNYKTQSRNISLEEIKPMWYQIKNELKLLHNI